MEQTVNNLQKNTNGDEQEERETKTLYWSLGGVIKEQCPKLWEETIRYRDLDNFNKDEIEELTSEVIPVLSTKIAEKIKEFTEQCSLALRYNVLQPLQPVEYANYLDFDLRVAFDSSCEWRKRERYVEIGTPQSMNLWMKLKEIILTRAPEVYPKYRFLIKMKKWGADGDSLNIVRVALCKDHKSLWNGDEVATLVDTFSKHMKETKFENTITFHSITLDSYLKLNLEFMSNDRNDIDHINYYFNKFQDSLLKRNVNGSSPDWDKFNSSAPRKDTSSSSDDE